jgi:hypothetical protein
MRPRHDCRRRVLIFKKVLDFNPIAPTGAAIRGARSDGDVMKQFGNFRRLSLAAALLATAGATAPVYAQAGMTDPDAAVACGAFQRFGGGSWAATAPTTLNYDNGMSLSVAPGETFAPDQTVGGIEVTSTLDRHCGNL